MKDEALKLIRKIRVASKDHYNDGWVMAGYKNDLKEIYDTLGKMLLEDSASGEEATKDSKLDLMG
jgi:hypothetical protein